MSGFVSTYDEWWRTQSRDSTGVSPSYVAARSSPMPSEFTARS